MRWKTWSTRTSKLVFYSKFCFFLKKHTPGTWKPCSNDLQSFVFLACLCLLPSKLQNLFLAARHASQSKLTPFRGDHRRKVCYLSFFHFNLIHKNLFSRVPCTRDLKRKKSFCDFQSEGDKENSAIQLCSSISEKCSKLLQYCGLKQQKWKCFPPDQRKRAKRKRSQLEELQEKTIYINHKIIKNNRGSLEGISDVKTIEVSMVKNEHWSKLALFFSILLRNATKLRSF